jgi:lipopolysaccharide export system protein LptA
MLKKFPALTAALLAHAAFALAAPTPTTPPSPPFPAPENETKNRPRPRIGTTEKFSVSDFDKDGLRLLELNADTATPEGALTRTGEPSSWRLRKLKVRFFDHDKAAAPGAVGREAASIQAEDCLYTKAARTATSPEDLAFDSEKFHVDGTDWVWRNEKGRDVIIFRKNVRATLKADIKADRERMDIFSERLEITRHETGPNAGRATFLFSGDVRAVMKDTKHGDVMLFGEVLAVRLKNTDRKPGAGAGTGADASSAAAPLALLSAASSSANSANSASSANAINPANPGAIGVPKPKHSLEDDTLESVVLSQNVRILTSEGREMTGELSSYVHATRVFTTTGDASVTDQNQGFTATGGLMLYRRKERRIEMFRARPPALPGTATNAADAVAIGNSGVVNSANTAATGETPVPQPTPGAAKVRLRIPSVSDQSNPGRARHGDGFTHITGDHLVIEMKPGANHAEMSGGVHAEDEDLALDAQRVLVEVPRDDNTDKAAASLLDTTPGVKPADINVGDVTAIGDVRGVYEGRRMACDRLVLQPEKGRVTLTGSPVLEADGASLSGHDIELQLRDRKRGAFSVVVRSAPPGAPEKRRVEVTLPALRDPATPAATPAAKPGTPAASRLLAMPTRVTADKLVMVEKDKTSPAEFHFTGGVVLDGGGLAGNCDRLAILADIGSVAQTTAAARATARPVSRTGANAGSARAAELARIHTLHAVGNVRIGTDTYTAEGGEAVVHPSVAVREKTPLEDNGLDGRAPRFLVLRPHSSTPGKRPRLTFLSDKGLKDVFANAPGRRATGGSAAAATAAKPMGSGGAAVGGAAKPGITPAPVPFHLDGDLLEIIGGAMRSRFFLTGNVALSGPELAGRCDTVQGTIVQVPPPPTAVASGGAGAKTPDAKALAAKAAEAKAARPAYAISRVTGRGDVRIVAQGDTATGGVFDYIPGEDSLHFTGSPEVHLKDGHVLQGVERLTHHNSTGQWESIPFPPGAGGRTDTKPLIIIPLSSPKRLLDL